MRLVELRLRNYRCYKNETSIRFDDLTALIGKNDSGKSTVMEALDIFLNESLPDADDACKHGQANDLCISGVFSELPASIVLDQDFPTTLADEYLLSGSGFLEIHKIFNGSLAKLKLTCLKIVAQHPTASNVEDLYLLTNAELKKRAIDVKADTTKVDRKVNAQLRAAIRAAIPDLKVQQTDVMLLEGNATNF